MAKILVLENQSLWQRLNFFDKKYLNLHFHFLLCFLSLQSLICESHMRFTNKMGWQTPPPPKKLTNLFSISSYSRLYSGIVDFRKFASQANSKHFLTGQKKSAETSLKCSKDATIYAGLATALNSSIFFNGSVRVSFCSNLNNYLCTIIHFKL